MAYIGKTPSQAVRQRYYYTASGSETSLSGADDNSNTLAFTDGEYVDVSLNGVSLVAGTDYNTNTANTIAGLSALSVNDIVEIVVYDTFSVHSGTFNGPTTFNDTTAFNEDLTVIADKKIKLGGVASGSFHELEIYSDGDTNHYLQTYDGELKVQKATGGTNKLTMVGPSGAGGCTFELNSNTTGGFQRINAAQTAIDFDLQYGGTTKLKIDSQGVTVENGVAVSTTLTDTTNSGSVTLNFDSYQNFILTLTGNVTLANPSTENAGQTGFIIFIQDGTGGRTVSLGTDYETAGGAGLTLSSAASAVDIVPYVTQSAGNILLGTPQLAFS